ncbi:MAG TPA: acetoacetate decarboxylase family protein [Trichocoleus sp.]
MAYPSAPWSLNGLALTTLHLLDVDRVRSHIPSELSIVSVLPGKTIGAVYFSVYTRGSVLEYSELIVAPAVLTHSGKIGSWVSHIYVDNPDSVAGGREIWGLPKDLAEFTWSNSAVRVSQQGQELCAFSFQPTWLQLPEALQPNLSGLVFTQLKESLAWFESQFQGQPTVVSGHLNVPATSPFKQLELGQPFLALSAADLKLKVKPPQLV